MRNHWPVTSRDQGRQADTSESCLLKIWQFKQYPSLPGDRYEEYLVPFYKLQKMLVGEIFAPQIQAELHACTIQHCNKLSEGLPQGKQGVFINAFVDMRGDDGAGKADLLEGMDDGFCGRIIFNAIVNGG